MLFAFKGEMVSTVMCVSIRSKIVTKYAKGMMVVDVLAVFPFEVFVPKNRANLAGKKPTIPPLFWDCYY